MLDKELDKFYTKPEVSKQCIETLKGYYDLEQYQLIEPSAGSGSFSNQIQMTSFDIEPEATNITKLDFLKEDISNFITKEAIILGNPPFGKKGSLALDFIKRSLDYAEVIAFILPIQFRKWSLQSKIPYYLKLIEDTDLPEESFLYKNKGYKVRCCFQIWATNTSLPDLRIKEKPKTSHPDFECYQYNRTPDSLKYFDYEWDFAIPRQGYYDYNTKITDKNKLDSKIQWMFIKSNTPDAFIILDNIDYDKLSKSNTSTPGFGKTELIKEYIKQKGSS